MTVELANGRTDSVASASRPDLDHAVGDAFTFAGALAIYSRDAEGHHEYAYLDDGTSLVAGGDELDRASH